MTLHSTADKQPPASYFTPCVTTFLTTSHTQHPKTRKEFLHFHWSLMTQDLYNSHLNPPFSSQWPLLNWKQKWKRVPFPAQIAPFLTTWARWSHCTQQGRAEADGYWQSICLRHGRSWFSYMDYKFQEARPLHWPLPSPKWGRGNKTGLISRPRDPSPEPYLEGNMASSRPLP